MKTVTTLEQLRSEVAQARAQGLAIGFVPTMGNLHAGHISLVERAKQEASFVITSIFVNPLQFGAGEDLDAYPRTLAADQEKLAGAGCHLLFAPSVSEMYPHGNNSQTRVIVHGVSEGLCASSRPGHFEGVATVVSKLFNMVQPDVAVFGEKDYQQLAVIRAMVRDLNMPIRIIGAPTQRVQSGLALSSRNGYLSAEQLALAPALYQSLESVAHALKRGSRDYAALIEQAQALQTQAGLKPEYLEIRNAITLQPAAIDERYIVILAAARLEQTRLIDNLVVELAQ